MRCANEWAADHYHADIVRKEEIDTKVESYANSIMADHLAPGELHEALSSMDDKQLERLSSYLRTDYKAAGRYVAIVSHLYWRKKAQEEAEQNRDEMSSDTGDIWE